MTAESRRGRPPASLCPLSDGWLPAAAEPTTLPRFLSPQHKRVGAVADLFQCLPAGRGGRLPQEQPGEAVRPRVRVQVGDESLCGCRLSVSQSCSQSFSLDMLQLAKVLPLQLRRARSRPASRQAADLAERRRARGLRRGGLRRHLLLHLQGLSAAHRRLPMTPSLTLL